MDLFASKKAFLSIPPFLDGRTQLTAEEALTGRLLAAGRIHVERAFGRLKEFRYLSLVH